MIIEGVSSVLLKNICCGYSTSRRGDSNEYPQHMFLCCERGDSNEYRQHMFLWRNKQNYPLIITKYPPYLFHCNVSQTKTSSTRTTALKRSISTGLNEVYTPEILNRHRVQMLFKTHNIIRFAQRLSNLTC